MAIMSTNIDGFGLLVIGIIALIVNAIVFVAVYPDKLLPAIAQFIIITLVSFVVNLFSTYLLNYLEPSYAEKGVVVVLILPFILINLRLLIAVKNK